jgi:hypothetical protein
VGVTVRAPDGREWTVKRSLRWPRWRGSTDALDWLDWVPSTGVPDHGVIGGILVGVVAVILLAIVIVVVLPLVFLLLELIVVVVASVFFRRSWVVVARSANPPEERVWRVPGFLGSRAAVREVADELRRGVRAEPENAVR